MTDKPDERKTLHEGAGSDEFLASYFAAARETAPIPSEALLERVLADAAVDPATTVLIPAKKQARRPRWQVWRALRGAVAGAGLVTATLVGVWIGVNPPPPVQSIEAALLGEVVLLDLDDMLAGLDEFVVEG